MTWEETIEYIRKDSSYDTLVRDSYLLSDLETNIKNYRKSGEYLAILKKIRSLPEKIVKILDIGCGNGITCISLAMDGFHVTAVEPDPSETVGCGAIRILKDKFQLSNIDIYQSFCEDIQFPDNTFDLVFARQCMHHANNLNKFVAEMARVSKSGGYFFTVRDHVVFDTADKNLFLKVHPLQKYYGGENAFLPEEYRSAISQAGLTLLEEIRYYDSEINYYPLTEDKVRNMHKNRLKKLKTSFKDRFKQPVVAKLAFELYRIKNSIDAKNTYDEKKVPGRMYSYFARK